MKSKLKYLSKNIFFFGLSKGIAFIAPIVFVKFVSLGEYGEIEFAYSTGSVCAVFLSLGLGGAYPYFILKRQELQKEYYFFLYGYFLLVISFSFLILFYCGVISSTIYLVYLFSAIFSLQRIYSSILKSNNEGYLGVIYDGGYYFLLSLVILFCYIMHFPYLLALRIGMEIYLGGLIFLFCSKYSKNKVCFYRKEECFDILKYSSSLILSGIIIFWLTSSSRIYIKYLMGYEQVGIYSLYFRYVGIAVIIYQFCYIAFFKKLYLSSSKNLDIYYSFLMIVVLLACLLIYCIYPFFSNYLLDGRQIFSSSKLYILLSVMMPIWIGIALNEGIISRENVIYKMNIVLGGQVVTFPLLLLLFKQQMTLELFTFLNVLMFCVAYLSQLQILKSRNILFTRCRIYTYINFVVTIIYYFTF